MKRTNDGKAIALQPLSQYDSSSLVLLRNELARFLKVQVNILPVLPYAANVGTGYDGMVLGDSVLPVLSKMIKEHAQMIIGITNKKLAVIRSDTMRIYHKDTLVYYFKNVLGYSLLPGKVSVISDNSLMTEDKVLWADRMKKMALHEVGHNLGLTHCPDDNCLMSEAYGQIHKLNIRGGDYCLRCRDKLK